MNRPINDPDDEIRRLRLLVKRLMEDQDHLRREISDLKKQLAGRDRAAADPMLLAERTDSFEVSTEPYTSPRPKQTPADPVFFRSLFRGREDVFACMWANARGRTGWSPACENEWVNGLCRKRGREVKCTDCPNRDFRQFTDQVIIDHLAGRHVVGVYPLLPSGDCRFLAIDFDGAAWCEDASAFLAVCAEHGIKPAVERSRSGAGGHLWIFFEGAVRASLARKLGSFLLTEAMSRRYEISMSTYDRLFPNQDNMPKGGFGNLIALPLQKEALANGNTCFLNSDFEPYDDQWGYLRTIERMSSRSLDDLSRKIARGEALGVGSRFADDDDRPWLTIPSRRHLPPPIEGFLTDTTRVVLGNLVYVEKKGLPDALLDHIRRLAAFQNPDFYKKQRLRLSTAFTPRMICCSEDFSDHLAIPRGCLGDLEALLGELGIQMKTTDERFAGEGVEADFLGELSPEQERAVEALLEHDTGVLVAPPGAGKTIMAIKALASRGTNALILVHTLTLMAQWQDRLSEFLCTGGNEAGRIGGDKERRTGRLDIGMLQSLVRKGEVKDLVTEYGLVIVDECHHVPAWSFEKVLREVKGRYVYGLTATPQRRDGHHPIILMQCGPVRHVLEREVAARGGAGAFSKCLVVRETSFRLSPQEGDLRIQDVYSELTADDQRNRMIVDDLVSSVREGRSPILLTERRRHLDTLVEMIGDRVDNLIVLHGGLTPKQRKAAMEELTAVPAREPRAIVATGRFIGEGFDDARLDTLLLAMPFSNRGTLIQYSGRLERIYSGKKEIRIFDYVDVNVGVLRGMFEKRMRGYRSIGYAF